MNRFGYLSCRPAFDIPESCFLEGIAQAIPVKTKVKNTVIAFVKQTIVNIQIGNAYFARGKQDAVELLQNRSDILDVMKSHAAGNQMETAFHNAVFPDIKKNCFYISQIPVFDFGI